MKRLRELDFLRGIAIILVLLRHIFLFTYTQRMGWIGVDLFFVLSGFLVSGLLFKEYIKFGNIQPKLFLIRRGYKIYPIYFIFLPLYLITIYFENRDFVLFRFLVDMTFTQNYINGWGFGFGGSWSLAVEEHFYFGFAFFLWLGLKYNKIILNKEVKVQPLEKRFDILVVTLLLVVLFLRLLSNAIFPQQFTRNFTMTHLRIDSLLFGVLISYYYHFRYDFLKNLFETNQYLLFIISILGLIWTPFIEPFTPFSLTIGFSLIYISFGILLIFFLFKSDMNKTLDNIFSPIVVNLISKIGFCSYSIYVIHSFVISCCTLVLKHYNVNYNNYQFFIITSTLSVAIGMIMTYKIEKYFLKIREKYYPNRV
jgi:peptidoglycan/LPS O-acetylase OafA/YrhL